MYFSVAPMRPTPPTPGFRVIGMSGLGAIVLPKVVPLRSRYRRRGVGQTTGQNIINQWSAIDQPNNPFIINNPSLAQNAAANTVSALDEYCANNPGDTSTCSGSSPLPSYVAEANQVGSTLTPQEQAAAAAGQTTPVESGADVGTYTGQPNNAPVIGPIGTTPPIGVTILPVVTISNQSRPGQPFQVGDSWLLSITGAPSQPVLASANFNGQAYGTNTPMGSTDSTGKFSTSGTFSSAQVGNWSEVWTVGGVAAASITFSVASSAAANTSAPTTANGSTSTGGGSATSSGACPVSFFSGESCLGGFVGTTTALVIGGVFLGLFLLGGRK
jgi:hypothetical protein